MDLLSLKELNNETVFNKVLFFNERDHMKGDKN